MKNQQIISRIDALTAERKTLDGTWETIERFIAPYRGEFFRNQTSEHEQSWRKRDVFDSTAIFDNVMLSNTIHSWLFPMGRDFFDIKFRDNNVNDVQEAREWLDTVVDRMHKELHQSNLNTESGETILDKTSFGTGYLLEEFTGNELTGENFGITFSSIPVKEAYFDEDFKGGIYAFYRRLMWTPTQILSKFGETNVPEKINSAVSAGKSDRMEVIFCIWKRSDAEEVDGIVAPEKRPYAYKYILKEGGEMLGEEGGYYEMPVFLSRWSKTSESKYGHSPAMIALNDVLTLNQFKELVFRRAEKEIDPPLKVTERGLLSDLDLNPAGLTVVRDTSGELVPLNSGGNYTIAELTAQDLVESIHRAFYLDAIQLKQSPQMTATEALERTAIMQRSLGPVISRNKPGILTPLIERTFNAMLRAGKLPPVPESIQSADIDIVYTGPLAASNNMDEAQLLQTYLSIIGGVAQFKPEVLDNIDEDAIARRLAEDMNIDPSFNNSVEEVEQARQARAEQQQQMAAAEQARAEGEAMQAVGKGEADMRGATGE